MFSLVTSSHSRRFIQDGAIVELWIYKLATDAEWQLEIVAASGDSLIWETTFCTDDGANEEFVLQVEKFGMASFLEEPNVVMLGKHRLHTSRRDRKADVQK